MDTLLPNWIPYKLRRSHEDTLVEWLYLKDKRFTEPFFQDTTALCKNYEENRQPGKPTSSLQELISFSEKANAPEPGAFIFHVSRCGSTLMSQLLALNPEHIVLSEVPLLDEILRLPFQKNSGVDQEQSIRIYQAALNLIAQKRQRNETNLFIKTDSWHLFFYPLLRSIYPETPFIVLYRDPVEVIRSQQKQRGMQSVPGTIELEIFGFTESDISFDFDQFMSKVLCRYFETINEMASHDPFMHLINYNEGFPRIMERVKKITGAESSSDWDQKMEERSLYHGKYTNEVFVKESLIETRPHWLDRCFELYEQADQKRKQGLQLNLK